MNMATWHPQVAHFVIALLIVGVIFRLVSLSGRLRWTGPAAATLILLGTLAAVVAVQSGEAAHRVPEQIPGARQAVEIHEEWGERTRNIFLVVAVLEIAALVLARRDERSRVGRGLTVASALVGLAGLWAVYETGEHGGELVYSYAGGIGTRSGDPKDVENLMVAALYQGAMTARQDGRKEDAARMIGELARLRPNDGGVRLLAIESVLRDRGDANGALAQLRAFNATDPRTRARAGLLRVDALQAAGQADSAKALLQQLARDFPQNPAVRRRVGGQ